jgi:hypothetical protein
MLNRIWKVLVLFGLLGFGVFTVTVGSTPPAIMASDDPVKVGGG